MPGDSQEFAKVLRLMIAGDSGGVLLSGLTFYPFELNNTHYHFIDCLFFKRGPLKYK